MSHKTLYQITVTNFTKYNSSLKKGHKFTLISNNFCADNKLGMLPLTHRWMFLGIVLTCGDYTSDTIELNERQLRALLESSKSVESALASLQSLQLLTYTKNDFLLNRIEEKRIEKKVKEKNFQAPSEVATLSSVLKSDSLLNSQIWGSYKQAYLLRYKVEPTRNASVNSKISQIGKRLGEDSIPVIQFYLKHNDSFYLKKIHDIGLCLKDAEALHTQWKRNQAVTSRSVHEFEKQLGIMELTQALENGENF